MKFRQEFVTLGHHQIQVEGTRLSDVGLNNLEDLLEFVARSTGDVILKSPALTGPWTLQVIIDG